MTSTQQRAATSASSAITLRGSVAIVTEFFHYALNNILFQRCIYPPSCFHFEKKYGLSLMVTKDPELNAYLENVLSQLDKWLSRGNVQQLVLCFLSARTGEVRERWTFNVEREKEHRASFARVADGTQGGTEKEPPPPREVLEKHEKETSAPTPRGGNKMHGRDRSRSPRRPEVDENSKPDGPGTGAGARTTTAGPTPATTSTGAERPRNPNKPTKTMAEITREIQGIMRQITASVSFLPVVDEIMAFDLLVYCDAAVEVPKAWEESGKCVLQNSQEVR
eukprot:g8712.t1